MPGDCVVPARTRRCTSLRLQATRVTVHMHCTSSIVKKTWEGVPLPFSLVGIRTPTDLVAGASLAALIRQPLPLSKSQGAGSRVVGPLCRLPTPLQRSPVFYQAHRQASQLRLPGLRSNDRRDWDICSPHAPCYGRPAPAITSLGRLPFGGVQAFLKASLGHNCGKHIHQYDFPS